MYFVTKDYENDMELLVTSANLVTLSGFVTNASVTANSEGKKYATSGSFIDADGGVINVSGTTISKTPIGILYGTIDVTNGDMPCSLIVEGYVRNDRTLEGLNAAVITSIKNALPNIKFR